MENTKYAIKFIESASTIHKNKYDYSSIVYTNNKTKVKIICPIHKEFEQSPIHHLSGSGCPKCGNEVLSLLDFLTKSKDKHGDFYDYSLVDYKNTSSKVKIICLTHGVFEQRPKHHYNGAGCPFCRESKGEREIRKFLETNSVLFIPQKRFKECRDKRSLPFDFYLPNLNTCIEYDGEQHFKSKVIWDGEEGLLDRQKKDKIKSDFCIKMGITLIRINNINQIKNLKFMTH